MKINRKQKELIKAYILVFAVLGVVANWDSVSWMFNYREISGLAYDFLYPYEDSKLLVSASSTAGQSVATTPVAAQKVEYPYSAKENSIEISAINITAPVIIGQGTQLSVLQKDLDKGTVLYPGSVLPGQIGQTILLGHSAPPGWPKIKHDWVFSQVNDLKPGDAITLHFNNRQYTYHVLVIEIIPKGHDVSASTSLDGKSNILTLVSCWPPGKDYKRIAVYAKLQ